MTTSKTFIFLTGIALSCFLFGTYAWAESGGVAPEAVRIGTQPQIFVDDALIARRSDVIRRTHAAKKLDEPVLEAEAPWELPPPGSAGAGIDERVYIYGTVLRDSATGGFRMWYSPRMGHLLYATSDDGLHWERSELGLIEFRGSKENNFLNIQAHSPSIVVNERAEDPEHRYVMFGYWNRRYITAHSPDGLAWERYPKTPPFTGGDTATLAQDPVTGEFLAFHKRYHKHRGESRRLVYLSRSPDMKEWSEPELVMAPDEIDDAQTKAEGGLYSEFYNMSAFPYGGQWLGLVTHFRYSGRPEIWQGPAQSSFDGPIDVQLVHSRNGRSWHRLEDRSPVIQNGPHDYDAGSILGVANSPVVVGDEIWMYYTAITTTHGGHLPEKKITIALARWRLDGFVSLDAGSDPGIVETVPLRTGGGRLAVNVDASQGALAVEVLDSEGEPLSGYSREDCVMVRSDGVRQAIRWTDREELPADQPIRIRFHLWNASLYSYHVGNPAGEGKAFRASDVADEQAILLR